jgi:hypothetical protein
MDKQKRKELKQAYRQTPRPAGVIAIRCKANGKVLFASSLNLNGLLDRHEFELRLGSHRNKELQKDWTTYGRENFTFEILEQLEPRDDPTYDYSDDLTILEELWLEELQPYNPEKGYNNKHTRLRQ